MYLLEREETLCDYEVFKKALKKFIVLKNGVLIDLTGEYSKYMKGHITSDIDLKEHLTKTIIEYEELQK